MLADVLRSCHYCRSFCSDLYSVFFLCLSTLDRRRVVAPSMLTDPPQHSKHRKERALCSLWPAPPSVFVDDLVVSSKCQTVLSPVVSWCNFASTISVVVPHDMRSLIDSSLNDWRCIGRVRIKWYKYLLSTFLYFRWPLYFTKPIRVSRLHRPWYDYHGTNHGSFTILQCCTMVKPWLNHWRIEPWFIYHAVQPCINHGRTVVVPWHSHG